MCRSIVNWRLAPCMEFFNRPRSRPGNLWRGSSIEFIKKGRLSPAELKVCGSLSTTKGLRRAIGQLLEYIYYRSRELAKRWFIVLHTEPPEEDRAYIGKWRSVFRLPLSPYWPDGSGFVRDSVSPRSADNAAPTKDN